MPWHLGQVRSYYAYPALLQTNIVQLMVLPSTFNALFKFLHRASSMLLYPSISSWIYMIRKSSVIAMSNDAGPYGFWSSIMKVIFNIPSNLVGNLKKIKIQINSAFFLSTCYLNLLPFFLLEEWLRICNTMLGNNYVCGLRLCL